MVPSDYKRSGAYGNDEVYRLYDAQYFLDTLCATCGADLGEHFGIDCDRDRTSSRRFTPKRWVPDTIELPNGA